MDLTQLLPQFGSFAFTIVSFVVALSIIVAIHEYGHYIVGRWSGIKAEVFSLGFGPVLWSRMDRHGTRWQIAALPFGGYVKFLGDSNAASVGAEAVAEEEKRRTMLGAPLWARAATVAAGPIFNFILSIAIFTGVILWQGQTADPLTYESAGDLGPTFVNQLQKGDQILAIAGVPTPGAEDFEGYLDKLPVQPELAYTVSRGGTETTVQGPWPYPPLVKALSPNSAAYDSGMKVGDVITAVDGQPIFAFQQLIDAVTAAGGRSLVLDVWRDGQMRTFTMTPRRMDVPQGDGSFKTRWLIGITGGLFFEPMTEPVGPWTALTAGAAQLWYILTSSLSGLGHMVTGAISSCNLSGPIGIAQTSGAMASQGASSFIWFVAVLSAAVGLLNLLPVPVLDGGHLMFHAYEAISRRAPSDRALRVLMAAGLTILLSLMIFAVANDLVLCP